MRPIVGHIAGHIVGRDAAVTARGEEPSCSLITAPGQAIYPRAAVSFLFSPLLRLCAPCLPFFHRKSLLLHTHLASFSMAPKRASGSGREPSMKEKEQNEMRPTLAFFPPGLNPTETSRLALSAATA